MGLPSTILLRDANSATSHIDIAATLSLPPDAANPIVSRAPEDSGPVPSASQSQMWVSRSRGSSDVLGIAGPFHIIDRADDVAADLDGPRHIPEEIDWLLVDRNQLGDWLAPVCDGDP